MRSSPNPDQRDHLTVIAAYTKNLTGPKLEPRFFTAEQVEAVAAQLDTTHPYGLLVRFAAWTGLRAGEMAGLNIGDVDLMRKTVRVSRTRNRMGGVWVEHTPKSGKAGTVPLMP